jgi:hypothetical protein
VFDGGKTNGSLSMVILNYQKECGHVQGTPTLDGERISNPVNFHKPCPGKSPPAKAVPSSASQGVCSYFNSLFQLTKR